MFQYIITNIPFTLCHISLFLHLLYQTHTRIYPFLKMQYLLLFQIKSVRIFLHFISIIFTHSITEGHCKMQQPSKNFHYFIITTFLFLNNQTVETMHAKTLIWTSLFLKQMMQKISSPVLDFLH